MKNATPVATMISKMMTPNAVIVSTDGVDEPSLAKLMSARRGAELRMQSKTRVENFYNRWRKAHPEIPIEYYDERFTSVLAHRAMIDGGVKKKVRKENKGLVDEISATIILQDYLQSRR